MRTSRYCQISCAGSQPCSSQFMTRCNWWMKLTKVGIGTWICRISSSLRENPFWWKLVWMRPKLSLPSLSAMLWLYLWCCRLDKCWSTVMNCSWNVNDQWALCSANTPTTTWATMSSPFSPSNMCVEEKDLLPSPSSWHLWLEWW